MSRGKLPKRVEGREEVVSIKKEGQRRKRKKGEQLEEGRRRDKRKRNIRSCEMKRRDQRGKRKC